MLTPGVDAFTAGHIHPNARKCLELNWYTLDHVNGMKGKAHKDSVHFMLSMINGRDGKTMRLLTSLQEFLRPPVSSPNTTPSGSGSEAAPASTSGSASDGSSAQAQPPHISLPEDGIASAPLSVSADAALTVGSNSDSGSKQAELLPVSPLDSTNGSVDPLFEQLPLFTLPTAEAKSASPTASRSLDDINSLHSPLADSGSRNGTSASNGDVSPNILHALLVDDKLNINSSGSSSSGSSSSATSVQPVPATRPGLHAAPWPSRAPIFSGTLLAPPSRPLHRDNPSSTAAADHSLSISVSGRNASNVRSGQTHQSESTNPQSADKQVPGHDNPALSALATDRFRSGPDSSSSSNNQSGSSATDFDAMEQLPTPSTRRLPSLSAIAAAVQAACIGTPLPKLEPNVTSNMAPSALTQAAPLHQPGTPADATTLTTPPIRRPTTSETSRFTAAATPKHEQRPRAQTAAPPPSSHPAAPEGSWFEQQRKRTNQLNSTAAEHKFSLRSE